MKIQCIEYCRAISILLIVVGHSFHPWPIDTVPEKVLANLITGGSTYFVFISGFLFHYVFYPRFDYTAFLIKKIKNVLLPYIFFSLLAFLLFVLCLDAPRRFFPQELASLQDGLVLLFRYLLNGRILTAYWYVPFVMIIFAMSPIFIFYISLSTQKQVWIFALLLLVSMLVHRPSYGLSPIHSVVYFLPIYLLGIVFSINYGYLKQFVFDKYVVFGTLVIALSIAQVVFYGTYGEFSKGIMFYYNGVDIKILQKICMIFFIISLLQRVEHTRIPVLSFVASLSFSIYFIHPFILHLMAYFLVEEHVRNFVPGTAVFLIKVIFVICISIFLSWLLKRLLGRRSKYIIGS